MMEKTKGYEARMKRPRIKLGREIGRLRQGGLTRECKHGYGI